MKKIGIITTFRQPNYGSVLQAYSLQYVIKNMGYQAFLIDYKYPNPFHWNAGLKWGNYTFLQKCKNKIKRILHVGKKSKMTLLNDFIRNEIICTSRFCTPKDLRKHCPIFDIYISGSDQIWNPNTMFGDMAYMFDFAPLNAKRIAYSSSFSCNNIPKKYRDLYKQNLNQFSFIGVRERNGIELVKKLTGRKDAQLVLDPTLLLNKTEWAKIASKATKIELPEKFILFYMLAYTYNPDETMGKVLELLQKKYQMPIVSLSKKPQLFNGEFIQIDRENTIGAYEFILLFERANMVVTSSFHGTAFAVNFGKPFLALDEGEKRNDDRIYSLLNSLGLNKQLIKNSSDIAELPNPYYDVAEAENALDKMRDKSFSFLNSSLKYDNSCL